MTIRQESDIGPIDLRSWAKLWSANRVDIHLVVHADLVPIHQAKTVYTWAREGGWCRVHIGKPASIVVLRFLGVLVGSDEGVVKAMRVLKRRN